MMTVLPLLTDMMHNVCGIYIIFSCDVGGNVDIFFLEPVGESTRISEAIDSSTMPDSLTSLTSVSDRPIDSSESHEVTNTNASTVLRQRLTHFICGQNFKNASIFGRNFSNCV